MRKRIFAALTTLILLFLAAGAGILSRQSFDLMSERERQRALSEEAAIARALAFEIGEGSYQEMLAAAQSAQRRYGSESLKVALLYGGVPMANVTLPAGAEKILRADYARATLLDGEHATFFVVHRLTDTLTLLCASDAAPLYEFRARLMRWAAVLCAAGALAALIAASLLSAFLTRPLRALARAAGHLARGDHEAALPPVTRDEVGRLTEAFTRMRDAIAEREEGLKVQNERKQALIDAMAHEMRTPLTAILAGSRLLQDGRLSKAQADGLLATMAAEAKRLSSMDERLMLLTRLREDGGEMAPFSLADAARDALSVFENVSLLGEGGTLLGERELIIELMRNLVVNAQRAGGAEPVCVTLLSAGFTVEDHGRGMTEEQIQRAFEPFYRADKSRARQSGGAGLGLTLCREIARLHNGSLSIASQPGRGTRVTYAHGPGLCCSLVDLSVRTL